MGDGARLCHVWAPLTLRLALPHSEEIQERTDDNAQAPPSQAEATTAVHYSTTCTELHTVVIHRRHCLKLNNSLLKTVHSSDETRWPYATYAST